MLGDKVRENRLRRIAERRGYAVQKSRRRDPDAIDYGGYMLIDARTNVVVLGGGGFSYSASLDDIEVFFSRPSQKTKRARPK
jgi:hypothetical protein